jgi:hypothetical protein
LYKISFIQGTKALKSQNARKDNHFGTSGAILISGIPFIFSSQNKAHSFNPTQLLQSYKASIAANFIG